MPLPVHLGSETLSEVHPSPEHSFHQMLVCETRTVTERGV